MPASLPGASFNVSTSRRRLSRSLTDAFSGSVPSELGGASALFEQGPGTGHFRNIPIDRIRPGGDRPRRSVDPDALDELAASIRAHGVLQPIRVRTAGGGRYEIIAGERRWIAARQAGLRVIPALIAASDDEHAYVESLVENVQREDLNAVDRAHALRHLRVNLGLQSWEEVGRVLGITRQHVFNLLRVTQLPEPIQDDVRAGDLSEKHARALLLLRDDPEAQSRLWERIHDDELSGDAALDAAQRSRRHTSATARREVHPSAPSAAGAGVVRAVDALLAALEAAAPGELLTSRGRLEELQERLASLLTAPPASRERVPPAAMGAVPVGHASAVNGEEWRSIVAPAAGNPAG
ncbi:MAG TPA: ParB/RepB/Spo0J family partition protein [Candidatus Dormibacteraeota bacterium]|nr:ParB/RepB/Spo0J family partition protein [Candidatus Dormibacteraeota bacterium]